MDFSISRISILMNTNITK